MIEPLSAVTTRIIELDGRLRRIDPTFVGLGPPAHTVPVGAERSWTASETRRWADIAASGPSHVATATGFTDELLAADATRFGPPSDAVDAGRTLSSPIVGSRVTQAFGPTTFVGAPPATVDGVRYEHFHDGIDFAAPLGRAVRAAAAGVVRFAGPTSDGAVVVVVDHGDGLETQYGHLAPGLLVRAGDGVAVGTSLGLVGLTGRTTGPHLHFELRQRGRAIDPAPWTAAGHLPGRAPTSGQAASLAGRPVVPYGDATASRAVATQAALARFDAIAERFPHAAEIREAAVAADVDPLLLAALIRAESGFRVSAVSSAGAMGLTQLMPATSRALGVGDPFDARESAIGGARYLAGHLRIYGRVDLALAAYQAGKGAVARAGGIPDSPTTRGYIERILGWWAGYIDDAER